MDKSTSTFKNIAVLMNRYISIVGLDGKSYTYRKRCDRMWNSVTVEYHRSKQKSESILYAALDKTADLENLKQSDLLYIGCQTQERMFRGDNLQGKNFHHREMRKGNNGVGLEQFLASGRQVTIYTISGTVLEELAPLANIFSLKSPTARKPHQAYSVEQLILHEGRECWAWNTKGADKPSMMSNLRFLKDRVENNLE